MTHYNDTIKTIKITTKLFNNQTQSLLESLQKNIDENMVEVSRVKSLNKPLVKQYEEALLLANRDRLAVHQDINERR